MTDDFDLPLTISGDADPRMRTQALKSHAIKSATKRMAENFAEYVVGEADTTLTVDTFGIDAVREAIHTLDTAGYRIDDRTHEPGEAGIGFAHSRAFEDLKSEYAEHVRLPNRGSDPVNAAKQIGVDGVDVWADHSMPDATAVVIHPDATVPQPPVEASGLARMNPEDIFSISENRPWLVKDPKGVVVVEVADD